MKFPCLVILAAALGHPTPAIAQASPAPATTASPPPSPGLPSAVVLDLQYLAKLKNEIRQIEAETPRYDPEVEKRKWSVLGLIGVILAVAWGLIRKMEETTKREAQQKSAQDSLTTFISQLDAVITKLPGATVPVDKLLTAINASVIALEKRVQTIEGRRP